MGIENFHEASQLRIQLAQTLADQCPIHMARDIIIVGSVSRNLADQYSDIEIEMITEVVPSQEERINWIQSIGGTAIKPYGAPIGDGSVWIIFKYRGYWIEMGWQASEAMQKNLAVVTNGETTVHEQLLLASVIGQAIVLRSSGLMETLKASVGVYPQNLSRDLTMHTLSLWSVELGITVRKVLAMRGDRMPLTERLLLDLQRILRVVFAINLVWEVDWKWLSQMPSLKLQPVDLYQRIDDILCTQDTTEALNLTFDLIKETLALVPESYGLSEAINEVINLLEKNI